MILDNRQITITEVVRLTRSNFYGRASAKIVPKLLNLEQKKRRVDIAQEILTTFIDDSDLTNHGCMAMTLKPKPNRPNGKRFATIDKVERKIETGAVGNTKNHVSEVFRGLEKTLA